MQDITALEKSLHGIAAAFQEGGLFFLIGVCAFLVYRVAIIIAKRKKDQGININLPAIGSGNGVSPVHSPSLIREHEGRIARVEGGIATLATSLETVRTENRQDHQQIFSAIEHLKSA